MENHRLSFWHKCSACGNLSAAPHAVWMRLLLWGLDDLRASAMQALLSIANCPPVISLLFNSIELNYLPYKSQDLQASCIGDVSWL